MITLRSYVADTFIAGAPPRAPLYNPATEEVLAETSTIGVDLGAAEAHARTCGGPALRELSFAARGQLLIAASQALHAARDELLALSMDNGGNTRSDAKFDVDGAIATLAAYGELGQRLGETRWLRDGEGVQPTRSPKLWGEHLFVPRQGIAVHINAFNFPAWGLCEKAAVAWLCGLPVITKPATSTAWLACRIVEILAERKILPSGSLQLLAGSVGDLLDRLGPQDVLAFTGSSETAEKLRRHEAVVRRGVRLNVEADSLNAAILGPDGQSGSELYDLFLSDVVRDITQKAGQKCTAIRRIFVPAPRLAEVAADLTERLGAVRVGHPRREEVGMGPLSTAAQLQAVREGIRRLEAEPGVRRLTGGPEPVSGLGAPEGKGYFVRPTLLQCDRPLEATAIHEQEVFGPVATIMAYEAPTDLAALVRRGGGGLVASLYSDDRSLVSELVLALGPYHGRLFLGSARLAGQSPGPGTALPQLNHGGPGRAGDGHELGGVRGMELYMQRCAIMGYRPVVESLLPRPGQP
ncbi:MAG: 3,4-dehydroadipyl-CoA semialdehyde dehydrogenase [Myxococcales bacterium]|nr:3,4-dehydroadipyl-CoA semialdehyde dehydrogenase [Myxococcota bacterium]MDW8283662.1 3,4-dehydroadipyl-CoA semialdehyde dehydrogenase [Myxococcales bacterium]